MINSRPADGGTSIRRRRRCEKCGLRFTTFERVEMEPLYVVKRNNTRERYDREKLIASMAKATDKRKVSHETIHAIALEIERGIYDGESREVTTNELGLRVLQHLKELDKVAYVRYASVYRNFQDLMDFNVEINNLLKS